MNEQDTSPEMTSEEYAQELSEQHRIRTEKLVKLKESGKNPYEITKFNVTKTNIDIRENFDALENETVIIAGRITSWRDMGKANFIDVRDETDRMQIYVRTNDIGDEEYAEFKKWDLGDIIGVEGYVFKTKRGEISIHAHKLTLLAKALHPIPNQFSGFRDQEMRYRQRYVDLLVNPAVKDTFVKRSQIIREIRNFLDSRGYLEVDTPVLHTLEIGAAARPFVTHHNTLDIDMYLRIETELYLKRLIVGGFPKVYEVGRIFRNEGMSVKHNPEFTTIEMYQAYSDYYDMMDLIEELYVSLTKTICGSETIIYQETEISMAGPWERLTMVESVKKYANVDYNLWETDEDAQKAAKEHHVELDEGSSKGHVLIAFFDKFVEDKLIQPTIIYDYPVENSPLAKRKPSNPNFTERFEYFIYAREMGNAFSELNDPIDQRERFAKQVEEKRKQGADASIDEDFITALEYGMVPTGGLGFGLDRLVMLLTDSASIRDVLLFPTMKTI